LPPHVRQAGLVGLLPRGQFLPDRPASRVEYTAQVLILVHIVTKMLRQAIHPDSGSDFDRLGACVGRFANVLILAAYLVDTAAVGRVFLVVAEANGIGLAE